MELTSDSCPHELRPGTTVCLHCRRVSRLAIRARRRRVLLRGSSALAVLSTLGTMPVVGRFAIADKMLMPRLRVASATVTDAGGDADVPKSSAVASARQIVPSAPIPAPAQQGATLRVPATQVARTGATSGAMAMP